MKIYPVHERVLGQLVADKAAEHGDRTFIRYRDRTLSYRDLDRISNRLANGLARLGVTAGTHVALMLENSPEIVLLYVALGKLGAVSVPINTAAKGELLAYYLKQSDSEMVIADAELAERLAPVTARVPKLRFVVSLAGEPGAEAPAVAALALPRSCSTDSYSCSVIQARIPASTTAT
jgi:crotonobetaine/carnitine-CoA ligase